MSQAAEQEELSRRSGDTSRRELPELLSMFQHSDSWSEKIRLFNIVTEMFLPHISFLDLEHTVFSQVLPKTVKQFCNAVNEISSQATELSNQNTELKSALRNILQDMIQWLEALTASVRYVCSVAEPLHFENIQSLPESVLHILKATFTHCKDSDSVYSGRLHLVSDLLQALFKKAVCLQKQLMELLDKTSISSSTSEKEVAVTVSVLHIFLDICSIVSKMDHALHANTWKFIIKQCVKHQSLIEGHLHHHDIVSGLCDDILLSFQSCLQLAEHMKLTQTQETADQRLFQKTLKLCRFFSNSLLHYTKEFMPFLSESCIRFHHLYLQIYSLFPPSLSAVFICDGHKNEIASVFLVVLEALILHLLSFAPFMKVVLSEFQELPREHLFPHCILLLNILDKLPTLTEDEQILWCSGCKSSDKNPRLSIFTAIFQSFAVCSPEFSLPVVMHEASVKGQISPDITIYQYIYTHLCAYVVLLPPACFSELESSLLNAVLSNRMVESLLAIDAWCFLARYGTAELCAHHVKVIVHMVKSCPSDTCQLAHLTVLLRRLLFLLDSGHQAEVIKMFPPDQAENLSFWPHVSLASLPSAMGTQVKKALFTTALTECSICLTGMWTFEGIKQLNVSLSALLTACNFCEKLLDIQHQSDVAAIIVQLCPLLCTKQVSELPALQETLCLVLALFAFIVKTVEPAILVQVVSLISSVCQGNSPSHVKLAALDFLSLLGKIIIPNEAQTAVLPKISDLFSRLLADETWIINQHALEAFTRFAEETRHEEIVPQSLSTEDTKNHVITFLNKVIPVTEIDNRRQDRLKEEQRFSETFFAKISQRHKEETFSIEPSTKRARKDTFGDEEYELHIETAEKSLISVQSLLQKGIIPEWLPEKLYSIQTLLTKLQKSCQQDAVYKNA
ncbi:FIGNL1-interacting regulator of recombination and mitosis isoform X2 [Pseudophryne corroboree]|uniref:FIGNL1-interacting regulator of recombination and mitosis isoform X2 n=1 Tax=Pseudophryne corroboree TaxID=495146 RepID=UPI003081F275